MGVLIVALIFGCVRCGFVCLWLIVGDDLVGRVSCWFGELRV